MTECKECGIDCPQSLNPDGYCHYCVDEREATEKAKVAMLKPTTGIRLTPWAFGECRPPAGPIGTD